MKRIGFWNLYTPLSTNNFMLRNSNAPIGDELLLPFVELSKLAASKGVDCVTLDLVNDWRTLDAIVFVDYPAERDGTLAKAVQAGVPLYLITMENAIIHPANFDRKKHKAFRKVFTWDDVLCEEDPKRYVKINYAQNFPRWIPPAHDRKLACMIASNKVNPSPASLYPERSRVIRWLEENAPDEFDLFGPGWSGLEVYKGTVESKRRALQGYRFAFCYENAEAPGYITEKMFDCMIAGTIPIYIGAPNVTRWIPTECFIDPRMFNGLGWLRRYLVEMPRAIYDAYREAIHEFVAGPRAEPFSIGEFVNTVFWTIEGSRNHA